MCGPVHQPLQPIAPILSPARTPVAGLHERARHVRVNGADRVAVVDHRRQPVRAHVVDRRRRDPARLETISSP